MGKYFVTLPNEDEKEVTVEEFARVERIAGFHGPGHYSNPISPATASFSGFGIEGRTEFVHVKVNQLNSKESNE